MIETNLTTLTTTLCQMMTIVPLLLTALTATCIVFSAIAACHETIMTLISSKHHH